MRESKENRPVSLQALRRMPYYLQHLQQLCMEGVEVVSSPEIAKRLQLSEVQVRKDFAAISPMGGKPKSGFPVNDLIYHMEDFLGYHNVNEAVLVGAGALGRTLLSYGGFKSHGVDIVAAFDVDGRLVGSEINGKKILHVSTLSELCRRLKIHIGVIAVPEGQAQIVCDQLIAGGILAIWNFAPVHVNVPEGTLILHENLNASLAVLHRHVREKLRVSSHREEKR